MRMEDYSNSEESRKRRKINYSLRDEKGQGIQGLIQPCTLEQAAAWHIAHTLVEQVQQLDITKKTHRRQLMEALRWMTEDESRCMSYPAVQTEIEKALGFVPNIRNNLSIFCACTLVLCRRASITKNEDTCTIIEVVVELQRQRALTKQNREHKWKNISDNIKQNGRKGKKGRENGRVRRSNGLRQVRKSTPLPTGLRQVRKPTPLPTKALAIGPLNQDEVDLLPSLLETMPNLRHISLKGNFADTISRALSRYCMNLESLIFMSRDANEQVSKDIIAFLFGAPSHLLTGNVLQRFCKEGEEYRSHFVPRFPNLRMMVIDFYEHDDTFHDVCILTLLLQPKIESLGRHKSLNHKLLFGLKQVWCAIYGPKSPLPVLPLKHVVFHKDLCSVTSNESLDVLHLLGNVTCFEKDLKILDEEIVENMIRMFCSSGVTTLALSRLLLPDWSSLKHLRHLRLSECDYSFSTVHLILDWCPDLTTLSVHPRLFWCYQEEEETLKDSYSKHSKLTALRLSYDLFKLQRELNEPFLESILSRLPNLRYLCHGQCMSWSQCNREIDCTASALASVLTKANLKKAPLLTRLQQLCCIPGPPLGKFLDGEAICSSLVSLVQLLPALRRLTLSYGLDDDELAPILHQFEHSSIELRLRCDMEHVFFFYDRDFRNVLWGKREI